MSELDKRLEAAVYRELTKICRRKPGLEKVKQLHERAYAHYRSVAGGYSVPVTILDVAYVNALAEYAAMLGDGSLHRIR